MNGSTVVIGGVVGVAVDGARRSDVSARADRWVSRGKMDLVSDVDAVPDDAQPIEPAPVVELTIPAHTQFVSSARLVASSLASGLEFSVDDIDELRIAVDEAITVLIDAQPGRGSVRLTFTMSGGHAARPDTLRIEGAILDVDNLAARRRPRADALVRRILHAVTDSFEFEAGGFVLEKSTSSRPS